MDNTNEWDSLIGAMTIDEMEWVKENYHEPVVIDLMHLDDTVQIHLGGSPREGHVVMLEKLLSRVRKTVNELKSNDER